MKWFYGLSLIFMMLLCACDSERATYDQCRTIFDHLVALELAEMGYDDPVLTEKRQLEFTYRYRKDIDACIGRKIPAGALDCALAAKTAESVSHDCLR